MHYFAYVLGTQHAGYEIDATFETIADAREHKAWLKKEGFEANEIKCFLFVGETEFVWKAFADFEDIIREGKSFGPKRLALLAETHGVQITKM